MAEFYVKDIEKPWVLVPGSSGRFNQPNYRRATVEDVSEAAIERIAFAISFGAGEGKTYGDMARAALAALLEESS